MRCAGRGSAHERGVVCERVPFCPSEFAPSPRSTTSTCTPALPVCSPLRRSTPAGFCQGSGGTSDNPVRRPHHHQIHQTHLARRPRRARDTDQLAKTRRSSTSSRAGSVFGPPEFERRSSPEQHASRPKEPNESPQRKVRADLIAVHASGAITRSPNPGIQHRCAKRC